MKTFLLIAAFTAFCCLTVRADDSAATFTLSKGDVIKSDIASDAAGHTSLTITFTPEKRVAFNAFTEQNLHKQVKFVCDGKVIFEPVINEQIQGPSMAIPVNSPTDAVAITESTLARLLPHELELKQQELEAQTTKLQSAAHADPLQNKLVSELQQALDTHDKAAFEKCFNFDGTDEELKKGFTQIEKEISTLPSYYVFVQNRMDAGKAHVTRDGKHYTLNGDWMFDVCIYTSKARYKGFVLPAGMANGKCQVLLTVEEKPAS